MSSIEFVANYHHHDNTPFFNTGFVIFCIIWIAAALACLTATIKKARRWRHTNTWTLVAIPSMSVLLASLVVASMTNVVVVSDQASFQERLTSQELAQSCSKKGLQCSLKDNKQWVDTKNDDWTRDVVVTKNGQNYRLEHKKRYVSNIGDVTLVANVHKDTTSHATPMRPQCDLARH